eukprot:Amastigsp_a676751_23.p4 type:complete len:201 gc:universal Amastigsp_a676751_23:1751-1149(-)
MVRHLDLRQRHHIVVPLHRRHRVGNRRALGPRLACPHRRRALRVPRSVCRGRRSAPAQRRLVHAASQHNFQVDRRPGVVPLVSLVHLDGRRLGHFGHVVSQVPCPCDPNLVHHPRGHRTLCPGHPWWRHRLGTRRVRYLYAPHRDSARAHGCWIGAVCACPARPLPELERRRARTSGRHQCRALPHLCGLLRLGPRHHGL